MKIAKRNGVNVESPNIVIGKEFGWKNKWLLIIARSKLINYETLLEKLVLPR